MRKLLSILLCVLIFVSVLPTFSVFADKPSDNLAQTLVDTGDKNDYRAYHKQYSSIKAADSVIELLPESISEIQQIKDVDGVKTVFFPDNEVSASWSFDVEQEGMYRIKLTYMPLTGSGNRPAVKFLVDGKVPFSECESISLFRWFKNNIDGDVSGKEIIPTQVEIFDFFTEYLRDPVGLTGEDFVFYFSKGTHSITLSNIEETFYLKSVILEAPETVSSYAEVSSKYPKSDTYAYFSVEGENAYEKSSASLTPKVDNSSVDLSPADPSKDMVNYIGSANWKQNGDTIKWKINVKETGLYQLGIRFRQNYVLNGNSYRCLRIDGKIPFSEAAQIAFKYSPNWDYSIFSSDNDVPYLFYLNEGEHILSLSVTMGPMADINYGLSDVVDTLGGLYRKITMITGETPDPNRDYDLFGQISGMEKTLTQCSDALDKISEEIKTVTGSKGNSIVTVVRNMSNVLKRMLAKPYFAADYKKDYYNNYCSIGSLVSEMREMALDIDEIQFFTKNVKPPKAMHGFGSRLWFSVKRFLASFSEDYNNFSSSAEENATEISLWMNWGRDQAQVLNNLISEYFTPEYNIKVRVKIVSASLVQAVLSNNSPDLYLRLSRSQPVNLAMRNALYDLSQFDDFNDVLSRFMDGAVSPYEYEGGTYAIPDTQQFYMLFYRKDIFDELNITVPKTWDEFLRVATIITRNNMLVGLPYVSNNQNTNSGVGSVSLFPTILLQNGGKVYKDNLKETALADNASLKAFDFWCKFYTDYKFPVEYSFFNRFRTGEMPMAIATYTQYTTLSVAAPEIAGRWGISLIPGVVLDDGTINNVETGGGTGSSILNKSKHKKEAWEFLKWWTSSKIQAEYSKNLESLLGAVERQSTANVEALKQMGWSRSDVGTLLEQWADVEEIPEVAGGYYTMRAVDQAFWKVYNKGKNPDDSITAWAKIVDAEIKRKRAEYGLS